LEVYTQCIGSDFNTWSPKIHLEELTGQAFDWHDLDARRQAEIVSALAGEGAMPGVEIFLEKLENAGIRKAVVSSSSHHWVDGWLEKIGLAGRFEEVICRGDAERIKPAPDLYLEAVRRLGIPAENCLVIEDSLNGIKAANAAGIPVWAVPNRVTACLDFSLATRVFSSLEEVAAEF
jgi:putative hydrolase of the HAD superfamily